MNTPIFDGLDKVRQEALKAGYKTGRAQMGDEVIAYLKSLPKPSKTIVAAILEIEAMK